MRAQRIKIHFEVIDSDLGSFESDELYGVDGVVKKYRIDGVHYSAPSFRLGKEVLVNDDSIGLDSKAYPSLENLRINGEGTYRRRVERKCNTRILSVTTFQIYIRRGAGRRSRPRKIR